MASTNFYPEAGDGVCVKYSATAYDWANVIAAASSTSVDYTSATAIPCYASGGGVDTYCGRAFFPFDTAELAGTTITAVTFHGYITNFDDNETWYAVPSTQTSEDQLTTSDYSKINKGTLYGSTTVTGTGAYTISLNVSVINKTGITKIAILHSYDYSSSSPGAYQHFSMAQNYGEAASNKPYLEVTYTWPVTTNYLKKYRRLSFQ
jgi:hypothetical protein